MLSVVIPALNEELAIAETVQEIQNVLNKSKIKEYEVIIVNDGSTDKTKENAEAAGAIVVDHPHNAGYGFSLKSGIAAAKYDTIIITDADCTYPFDETPKLLEAYSKGFDMVVGARTGKHYKESLLKTPLRALLRFLVEFTAGRKIPDINSGLRVFSKKTIVTYFPHLCNTFSFTTSATLAYMMTGKFVHYIPIPYHQRKGKSKVKLFRDSLRTLQYILQAINYYNPIKIFLLFFIICIFLSLIFLLCAFLYPIHVAFYLGVGSALCSILVICFGLIADLLKQIMDKTNTP